LPGSDVGTSLSGDKTLEEKQAVAKPVAKVSSKGDEASGFMQGKSVNEPAIPPHPTDSRQQKRMGTMIAKTSGECIRIHVPQLQESSMGIIDTRIRRLTRVGLICAFAAAPALAASPTPNFKAIDSNGDGVISLDEFVAMGGQAAMFRAADTNGDNRLDPDEFAKISGDKAGPTS
jgi:hypothetical protein